MKPDWWKRLSKVEGSMATDKNGVLFLPHEGEADEDLAPDDQGLYHRQGRAGLSQAHEPGVQRTAGGVEKKPLRREPPNELVKAGPQEDPGHGDPH